MTNRPLILPPLRRTAKDAEAFARVVHEGQTDKAGRPYIEHVGRVAARAGELMFLGGHASNSFEVDEVAQIGWLHDVVEDTNYRPIDLLNEGFPGNVVSDVMALTKLPDAAYHLTIGRLGTFGNLPTILVKIADVEDNSDPERLALLDEPTRTRLNAKYGAALPILKAAVARLGWRKGNG
jgi:hypothetical protein